jgi:hypothetical protein
VKFKKNQQGMTIISLLVLVSIIILVFMLILKIVPIYTNNYKLVGSLNALKSYPELVNLSSEEIKNRFNKNLDMNMVTNVTDQDIKIVKQGDILRINVEYERVEPIVGNLSVLVQFHEGFEIHR